jgi:hypothetical protein
VRIRLSYIEYGRREPTVIRRWTSNTMVLSVSWILDVYFKGT